MSFRWQLQVFENQDLLYTFEVPGAALIGRQNNREPDPFAIQREGNLWRVIIAPLREDTISRSHLLVEPYNEGLVRISNRSSSQMVQFAEGQTLSPGESVEKPLPVTLALGRAKVLQLSTNTDGVEIQSLSAASLAPGHRFMPREAATLSAPILGENDSIFGWMHAAMDLLQSAASSSEIFAQAAHAVVDLAGLDCARVLTLEGGRWKSQAQAVAPGIALESNFQPSRQVLDKVRIEKSTCWKIPSATQSLERIVALVAAPILNPRGDVIGALYGDRRLGSRTESTRPITRLEAMLVQLLASGLASGLARIEQEKAAFGMRVQLEQFFTPELARQLIANPNLLVGRDQDVTVLVVDIRGFSTSCEKMGTTRSLEWINDVMGVLSDCVLVEGGVVVDYVGDEMLAMWGAPGEQIDHAARACRAALAMIEHLPELDQRWQTTLGHPMGVGVGINTGLARVGNVGSPRKFKYGPLGKTVNVASRVQGATKYLKTPLLITHATRAMLPADTPTRRLCQVRVQGIDEPSTLYELATSASADWLDLKKGYESALACFEGQQFRPAARLLGELLPAHPLDGPALVLMSRVVQCLVEEPVTFDSVWRLPGK